MAFPVVNSTAQSIQSTFGTSHPVDLPATVVADELLLIFTSVGTEISITPPAGWTLKFEQSFGGGSIGVLVKIADGTEDGTTVTYTTSASARSASVAFAISDWNGSLANSIDVSTPAAESAVFPDSPSLTTAWGSDDNLFFSGFAVSRDARSVSVWPTGYTANRNEGDSTGGGGGATYGIASDDLATATEDPSGFTLAEGTANSLSVTIAIQPVSVNPSITTIVPDPATTGAELTSTGINFEALQGTGGVDQEQGAVVEANTINSWSATEVTSDSIIIESSQLKYGTQTQRVTNDTGNEGTKTFVANPATGNDFVDLTSVAEAGDRITALPDLAANDQIRYADELSGGGGFSVVVNADATFSVDGATPDGTYTFEVRAWDDSDQTWGTAANQTVIIGAVSVGGNNRLKIGISIGI